jgi:hypothetical protein
MNAKDKALVLTKRYFVGSHPMYAQLNWTQAKKCATIAVDVVLETNVDTSRYGTAFTAYWNDVKTEIGKL